MTLLLLQEGRGGQGPHSAKFAAVINKIVELVGTPQGAKGALGSPGLTPSSTEQPNQALKHSRPRDLQQRLQQRDGSQQVQGLQQPLEPQQQEQEGEKVLVFSEWREVLLLLRSSLRQLNISSLCYYGSRKEVAAIKAFSSSTSEGGPQVLLCCLRKAGRGLNLTAARYVLFVDFPLNAAEETQAIGRVYRISQTRQTHVWR